MPPRYACVHVCVCVCVCMYDCILCMRVYTYFPIHCIKVSKPTKDQGRYVQHVTHLPVPIPAIPLGGDKVQHKVNQNVNCKVDHGAPGPTRHIQGQDRVICF